MSKWLVGKRRWYLVVAVVATVSVVILAAVVNYEQVTEHMYPHDAIYENSNVTVRGMVTSVKRDYKSQGFIGYHIFRFLIGLNVTEVVWVGEHGAGALSDANGHVVSIGYDILDNPRFSVGQVVECRGFYLAILESPYSRMITVAPSVSGSYIESG